MASDGDRITYTDEEVTRWLEMYNDGKTIEDISLELDVTTQTVGVRLRKHPDYIPRGAHSRPESWRHDSVEAVNPGAKITKVVLPKADLGHRRRGRGW